MAVTVEIKTGSRRVISYLLPPLLRYKQDALRERQPVRSIAVPLGGFAAQAENARPQLELPRDEDRHGDVPGDEGGGRGDGSARQAGEVDEDRAEPRI